MADRLIRNRTIESSVAARALRLWFIVRVAAGMFSVLAGGDAVSLTIKASFIIIAVSGYLAALDARKHNEDLFLANLGTSNVVFVLLCSVPPLIGEIAVAAAVAVRA
jgi:hypothetical protein